MKRLIGYSSCVALAGLFAGCVSPGGPPGAVMGMVYTDVSGPIGGSMAGDCPKMGQASVSGIICVATGDSSIKTAAANGGVTKIHYVDYHATSVLGVWAKTTVTVYGE